MGIFSGCGTVFLKEGSEASVFISKMEALSEQVDGRIKREMDKQIKIAKYGLAGEENISFELKNSGIDMFVLHDIYLEYGDLSAQIDYLIVAKKNIYVIECKNMIGNIEIDNKGSFIRTYELYGKKIREGIYSPITQNERHLNILKGIRMEEKNALSKIFFEKNFDNFYKSIICLANPKTILNDKYAQREVKEKVVRADQLIAHIKKLEKESKNESSSQKQMRKLAEFFLELSKPNKSDYTKKYEEIVKNIEASEEGAISVEEKHIAEERDTSPEEKHIAEEKDASPEEKHIAEEKDTSPEKKTEIEEKNIPPEGKTEIEEKNTPPEEKQTLQEEENVSQEKICPRCGGNLILRTAKRGEHAGNQFYGCDKFPKCRYVENKL